MITINSQQYYFDRGVQINYTPIKRVTELGDGYTKEQALYKPSVTIVATINGKSDVSPITDFFISQQGAAFPVILAGRTFNCRVDSYTVDKPHSGVYNLGMNLTQSLDSAFVHNTENTATISVDRGINTQTQLKYHNFSTLQSDQTVVDGINSAKRKITASFNNRTLTDIMGLVDYFYYTKGVRPVTIDGITTTLDYWTLTLLDGPFASLSVNATEVFNAS